jgi:hypothetical protein
VPVPLPRPEDVLTGPPSAPEAQAIARGVVTAAAPATGLTELQEVLVEAMFDAMTGHAVDVHAEPLDAAGLAGALARRDAAFRTRIVQVALLTALVLRPLPPDVAARIEATARELSVDDGMVAVARRFAEGQLGLAAFDFDRNGYTADWSPERQAALHTSRVLESAWEAAPDDPELAARWRALEQLPPGTLGRRMTELYRARGFTYPGEPGSAPPLLAQHDWVHLVADYGTVVESELEVFAFVARANDDPRGFSLLAMVVSLFETGYLRAGAGLFEAFPGQLSRAGVATRVADAMRRGALARTDESDSVDFLAVDWFALADRTVEDVRAHFHVPEKSAAAIAAGSVGPWQPGGISPYQLGAGQALAARLGVPYDAFGAAVR